MSLHLGLDLGVTNLKWALVERAGNDWRTVNLGQQPTESAGGPATVVPQVVRLARAHPAQSIGIGIPGLYEPDEGTTVFFVNMPGDWAGVPLAGPVRDATGVPTALINDARAFGLAELRLGAGRGCRTLIGLTLGTGVGGVVVIDGRVHLGYKGTAGELGHQVIDPDGPMCNCGTQGCMEAHARADRIAEVCGQATVEDAVRAARAGDRRVIAGLAQVGRALGIGISNAIVVVNPERVVIGGGIAAAGDLLFDPIRQEIADRVHVTAHDHIRIVAAELGPTAGAIGAAIHGAEQATMALRSDA
jgi:glucokinase